jgi:two-component system LytT family response regulator
MSDKIKALIVEDDKVNITILKILLDKYCPEIEVIAEAETSEVFIDLLFDKNPDLLFLDIHLGEEKNSLEILAETEGLNCEIIIISGDETYAIEAINKYKVAGYISKPIKLIDLKKVILHAINKIELRKVEERQPKKLTDKLIAVSDTKNIEFISIDDILYLEADGKYTVFYLVDGKTKIVSKNIGEYEKSLPNYIFFRVHHKYIINIQKVESINKSDGTYCYLTNGKSIPIAKRRQEALRNFLNL